LGLRIPNITKLILVQFLSFIFLPCCKRVLPCTITSHNCYLYKHINYYLVTLILRMFPTTAHTCQPHFPNIKTIISINLKSTITKTKNHIIIHSQHIVISHNTTTINYIQVHINCLNTYMLVQSSQNKIIWTHTHINQFINYSTSCKHTMLNKAIRWHNRHQHSNIR